MIKIMAYAFLVLTAIIVVFFVLEEMNPSIIDRWGNIW